MPEVEINTIHGYPLFFDVEDKELRAHNQATILANIIEDNMYEAAVHPHEISYRLT